MKRISIAVLLFLSVSLCFAKGQRDSFEVGIGFHSITEKQTVSGIDVETTVPSFAINFAGISLYTDTIGIGAYGNLLFPQSFKLSAQGQSVYVDKSAYDFLFAMDFLIGPAFMLYNNDTICVPLSAGIHYYQLWSVNSVGSTNTSEIGIGANITGEYHFTPKVYAYARFQLSLDFFSWGTTEVFTGNGYSVSQSNSGSLTTWGINPCIGIGFQW